ncbi:MAG TPA: hypothetical protein DCS88_00745 [Alphaproteobacteria bacterium]|nr:hypothetical protein [Alphaproteobacteria bacterium]
MRRCFLCEDGRYDCLRFLSLDSLIDYVNNGCMKTTPPKHRYRIRNWREYNAALVNRGRLTIWFDEKAIDQWYAQERTGKPGASQTYSDVAVQCVITI